MPPFKPYAASCPPLYGIRHRRTPVPKKSQTTEDSGSFPVRERDEPQPGVDYPRDETDVDRMFPSEVAVHRYLERIRYPRGFTCSACGNRATPWRSGTGLLACGGCRHPAPLRAGTLFQASPIPLQTWLKGLWAVSSAEASLDTIAFAELLRVDPRVAAEHLRNIRAAMAHADAPPLEGNVYVATARVSAEDGRTGADAPLVAMAVDVERMHHPRVRLRQLAKVTSREIQRFVVDTVAPCSKVVTAPWRGFSLITDSGYQHEVRPKPLPKQARGAFGPAEVWSSMRLWLWTAKELEPANLQPALDDFSFRFNRRHYPTGQLFYRLMLAVTENGGDEEASRRAAS